MHSTYSGSTLLMMILFSGVLVLLSATVVRSISYMTDLAVRRALYEQHYYAFKGLVNYGKTLTKNYASSLATAHDTQHQIKLSPWLSHYQGTIKIKACHDKPTHMEVQLLQHEKVLMRGEFAIKL